MSKYLERAKELKDELVANRRAIHQNPEVFDDLTQTVAFVKERLIEMGYEPQEICKCGLTATVGGKRDSKTFLLRADMDALPMTEESGLPFCSKNANGHTCGHDLHTAMLLGAAKLLKEHEGELEGTVRLMFQPDEEGLTGAQAMVDAGILRDVDAAMAFHVFPGKMAAGAVGYGVGPIQASSDRFRITVTGKGGHGAMPHTTIDPINAAAHIYLGLQEVIAREVDANDQLVMTVGSFNAGDAPNIIPERAVLEGSIRAYNKDTRAMAKQRLEEIAKQTAKLFRCDCEVVFIGGCPANVNNEKLTMELLEYIKEDAVAVAPMPKSMGSEDFAVVSDRVPGAYFGIGAGGEDPKYSAGGPHSPKVHFNEDVLPYGAAILANCAQMWLKNNK